MSLIRLKNVGQYYERQLVLREVFFRLKAGERVGVIGPNGSGKTTLLKLMRLLVFDGTPHLRPVAGNWTTWQASQGK